MKGVRTSFAIILLVVSMGSAIWSRHAAAGTLRVLHSIAFPSTYSRGVDLAWDGEHLWTEFSRVVREDEYEAATFELDPLDGSVVSRTASLGWNRGYVWDGSYVWAAELREGPLGGGGDDLLLVVGPESPPPGQPAARLLPYSPDAQTRGAAWDGQAFWFSDNKQDVIVKVRPDMSVERVLRSPGSEPRGLAWDGISMWCVDDSDDLIYQMDTLGNILERWSSPATKPFGLTFDGEHLWLLDNGTKQIFQLAVPEPSTLVLLGLAFPPLIVWLKSAVLGCQWKARRNGRGRI